MEKLENLVIGIIVITIASMVMFAIYTEVIINAGNTFNPYDISDCDNVQKLYDDYICVYE